MGLLYFVIWCCIGFIVSIYGSGFNFKFPHKWSAPRFIGWVTIMYPYNHRMQMKIYGFDVFVDPSQALTFSHKMYAFIIMRTNAIALSPEERFARVNYIIMMIGSSGFILVSLILK